MTDRQFAAWVTPIALRLEQSRYEIEETVREVPATAWIKPSGYPGWSYKDQLAHLAGSHRGLHSVLGAVLAGGDPEFSRFDRIDQINEANRQHHLAAPVEDLLAAFVTESQETQRILGEMGEHHAGFDLGPMMLSQALQGFALHDAAHLAELRKALPL